MSRAMGPKARRQKLLDRMQELESQGLDCRGCKGTCCTYEANSMMITPLETLELLLYMRSSGGVTVEFKKKIQETVARFRLDQSIGNGHRSYIRRTYTCPFFNHGELGCPLPREVKPYGCLAFNSHDKDAKSGSFCFSEKGLLIERESLFPEEEALNKKLKEQYGLYWDKLPLPLALLEMWEIEINDVDPVAG